MRSCRSSQDYIANATRLVRSTCQRTPASLLPCAHNSKPRRRNSSGSRTLFSTMTFVTRTRAPMVNLSLFSREILIDQALLTIKIKASRNNPRIPTCNQGWTKRATEAKPNRRGSCSLVMSTGMAPPAVARERAGVLLTATRLLHILALLLPLVALVALRMAAVLQGQLADGISDIAGRDFLSPTRVERHIILSISCFDERAITLYVQTPGRTALDPY